MAEDNSGMSAVVAIVAIIAVVAIGYLVFRGLGTGDVDTPNGGSDINVEIPGMDGNQ